ncbi:hypothetical protein WISP_84896 [Willisornis vidua]|uniref:Zinc finger CHCC-type domain-containing protein n=1 Tax=Willisornis vidua TaxID=1566151 RepID=A0ABQ9D4H6_9PASS|nr:hypothetical protein WISP_84896 [Willisornis vidua]
MLTSESLGTDHGSPVQGSSCPDQVLRRVPIPPPKKGVHNFLSQEVEDLTRNVVLLSFILIKREGLVGDVKAGGSLGCSDHEIVEFSVRSWRSEEVPEDWKKPNVTPVFKKSKKEDLGNCQPVCFTSIPRKIMEDLIPEAISIHMDDKKEIRSSQHGFSKDQVQCLHCDEALIKIAASNTSGIRSNNKTAAIYLPQVYEEKDYRRVRFVGRQKEVNKNFAIDLIAEQPVSEVESRVISCDGGGGALGHPKVYINLIYYHRVITTISDCPSPGQQHVHLELAGIGSIGHGGSFQQLLTEATSVASSPQPKPGHANPVQ